MLTVAPEGRPPDVETLESVQTVHPPPDELSMKDCPEKWRVGSLPVAGSGRVPSGKPPAPPFHGKYCGDVVVGLTHAVTLNMRLRQSIVASMSPVAPRAIVWPKPDD